MKRSPLPIHPSSLIPHPSSFRPHPSSLILLLALLLSGCGSSGPETCTVTGTVTWNGSPVPEGNILFTSADGKGVPDSGRIEDGKYKLEVKPGKKKVAIHAEREVGEVDPIMGARPRRSYIPPKYNVQTELTAEVTPGAKNAFPFELVGPEPE